MTSKGEAYADSTIAVLDARRAQNGGTPSYAGGRIARFEKAGWSNVPKHGVLLGRCVTSEQSTLIFAHGGDRSRVITCRLPRSLQAIHVCWRLHAPACAWADEPYEAYAQHIGEAADPEVVIA